MGNKRILAQIGLIVVTIIWGTTFVIVKQALNDAPPFSFAALRFGLASILSLIVVNFKIFQITKNEIIGGIICGFLLFAGYAFQNFGLLYTTPTKSAFITGTSIIMVPIILVIIHMQKISMRTWIACILAITGMYFLLNPMRKDMQSLFAIMKYIRWSKISKGIYTNLEF